MDANGNQTAYFCGQAKMCPISTSTYVESAQDPWVTPGLYASQATLSPPGNPPPATAASVEFSGLATFDPNPDDNLLLGPHTPCPCLHQPCGSCSPQTFFADLQVPVVTPLQAVFWTHVLDVAPLQNVGGQSADSLFSPWSNHYVATALGSSAAVNPENYGQLSPACGLDGICPLCPLITDNPNWSIDPVDGTIAVIGATAGVDLTSVSSAEAVAVLTHPTGLMVPVAESGGWLTEGSPVLAEATSDGTGVTFALGQRGGTLNVVSGSAVHPDPPAPRTAFAAVLSGKENAVFVIGGLLASSAPAGDVWRYSLAERAWTQLPVAAGSFGTVIAATYRPDDRSLYLIDQVEGWFGTQARLVRLDVGTSHVTVVGSWPHHPGHDAVFLSNAPAGDLLIASSSSSQSFWRAIRLRFGHKGNSLIISAHARGRGLIALRPTLTERGLTVPVTCASLAATSGFDAWGFLGDWDDDPPDATGSCPDVYNVFVPSLQMHQTPAHSPEELL